MLPAGFFTDDESSDCHNLDSSLSNDDTPRQVVWDSVHDIVADYVRHTRSDPCLYELHKQELFWEKSTNVSMDDFQICKLLGSGAFGKVYLVKRPATNDIYALKTILFSDDVDQVFVQNLLNERQVFSVVDSTYVVTA